MNELPRTGREAGPELTLPSGRVADAMLTVVMVTLDVARHHEARVVGVT